MPRYLIKVTQENAAKLEAMLGGRVEIVQSQGHIDEPRDGAVIAGLDAVFDEELEAVDKRLGTSGPRYHAGGPGRGKAPWVHGTRLGREHTSVREHLVEDHGVDRASVDLLGDGAVHGLHDGRHHKVWAYAEDLPHLPPVLP